MDKASYRSIAITTLLLISVSVQTHAKVSYACPDDLKTIEHGAVYSFHQAPDGALWMNTNYGLYRYNGHNLEHVYSQLPYHSICGDDGECIYLPSPNSILRVNTYNREAKHLRGANIDYQHCAMAIHDKSLLVATGDRIYTSTDRDSLVLKTSLPQEEEIRYLQVSPQGAILIATASGRIYSCNDDMNNMDMVFETDDAFSSLYYDHSGHLWAGLLNKGVLELDKDFHILSQHSHAIQDGNKRLLRDARTFCEDASGNIYVGAIDGLFEISPEGQCTAESEYSPRGHSICALFKDREKNIWVGTFYNGAFLCEVDNSPFQTIDIDESVRLINSLVEDKRGDIWIVTDHYGLWRYDIRSRKCVLISHTLDRKFKSAYYDKESDAIWIGEHMGCLNKYDIRSGKWSEYPVISEYNSKSAVNIYDIKRKSGEMYLAAADGIYLFWPEKEKAISRKIPGYDTHTYALESDENGTMWICGNRLYRYTSIDGLESLPELHDGVCSNIHCGENGELMLATLGEGFIYVKDGLKRRFNSETPGLPDDYGYFVDKISDSLYVGGTRTGLSIIDIRNNRCYNYGQMNGLGLSSAREGYILHRSNGTIWIGGTDGIVQLDPASIRLPENSSFIAFDNFKADGQKIMIPRDGSMTLDPEQNHFTVDVTDFNYAGIIPSRFEYKLEGSDDSFHTFNPQNELVFANLQPGRYKLIVRRKGMSEDSAPQQQSLDITIKTAWYRSITAIILYIVLACSIIFTIAYMVYSRKLLARELESKKKENDDRMRFFINVSHELRTPLTMIIGHLELFFRTNGHKSKGANNIENSYKQARQMHKLVSDLLDFEKQNQGYTSIAISKADLCSVLSETKENFAQYAQYRNISLSLKLPVTETVGWIDTKQMKTVLSNLLANSFKFTNDGGSIEVALEHRREAEEAIISISDTGSGISPDALKKIFDPFYQDPVGNTWERKNQGTGIGLAICKGIIELHHGTIEAFNTEHGGAKFIIRLPLNDKWYEGDSKVSIAGENSETSTQITPYPVPETLLEKEAQAVSLPTDYKMLIIEDDADMQAMLVSIFKHKYNIITASDGASGLDAARTQQPDIIISDVAMPVMDGLTLCSSLRKDFETCHIPVILLTAHTSIGSNIEGINMGADDYITKPFCIEILEARCANLLENRRILREKFKQSFSGIDAIVKTEKDNDFMSRLIGVVEQNLLSPDLNVNLLCKEMHISRPILDKKIKGITGNSPREFIENIKMKQAVRLLQESQMNISEIAYELGFSSPKYFAIRFKKIYGVNPSHFKS